MPGTGTHTVHVQYTCIYYGTCTVLVCSSECKCVLHVMPVCVLSVYMWVCSIVKSWSKRSVSCCRIAELREQLAWALHKIEDLENHLTRTEHELTNMQVLCTCMCTCMSLEYMCTFILIVSGFVITPVLYSRSEVLIPAFLLTV